MSINLPEGSSASTATSCFPVQAGKEMLIFISENNMEDIFPSIEELIRYIDKTQGDFTIMKTGDLWRAMRSLPSMDQCGYAEVSLINPSNEPRKAIIAGLMINRIPLSRIELELRRDDSVSLACANKPVNGKE